MCTRSRFRERRGISAPWDYLVHTDLVEILEQGFEEIRMRIGAALHEDESLEGMGLETVAVRIAAVRPEAEVEKALRTPTRESIQQQADEATFQRRALAVEKERAIQENELQNRIATDCFSDAAWYPMTPSIPAW
jgi:regulator of protease activity HflC (stomatin/prohibitin superfamily)